MIPAVYILLDGHLFEGVFSTLEKAQDHVRDRWRTGNAWVEYRNGRIGQPFWENTTSPAAIYRLAVDDVPVDTALTAPHS